MKKGIMILGCVICLLSACTTDIIYSNFRPIVYDDSTITHTGQWHKDSIISFDYQIADTSADYSVLIYVRHTERYPYQNMWLFVSNGTHSDTIEFYLADDRGQWLGADKNGFIEMPILFDASRHYPDTGFYQLSIQHGMRDTLLRGVMDVGLEIAVSDKE